MSNPDGTFPDPIDFAAQGRLLAAATPGPWCTTQSATATKEDAVEWFRHHISFGADMPMAGVGCPDHPLTVIGADPMRPEHMVEAATTGNGPASVANAAAIASMRNTIDAYREVVVAAKALADAVNSGKFTRAEDLLPKLDAALARFRNVGGAS